MQPANVEVDEEQTRQLPGDELLPPGTTRVTHAITIAATPERIWPWLAQMGVGRAGWYSRDALDNGGHPSARVIVPELQQLELGQLLPTSADGREGFTVLALAPPHALVLGAMLDRDTGAAIEFFGPLPERYWRATWAFVLVPLDAERTRLLVRASIDYAPLVAGLRLPFLRLAHRIMQGAQLQNLAARVEGRLPHHEDAAHEVGEGIVGAAAMLAAFATPFLRGRRARWGLTRALAEREYPGDALVPRVRWGWTHGIEIDAPPADVWPWIAQLGRDKAGFYSYQLLENLVGCDVQNADHIVEAWQHPAPGDLLQLHPETALTIVAVEPFRWLLAHASGWPRASWLFFLEPLDGGRRTRCISRYRCGEAEQLALRIAMGPTLVEPLGFVMDRRMLLGIKERAEARRHARTCAVACP